MSETHKYAPVQVMTHKAGQFAYRPVQTYIAHPPSELPRKSVNGRPCPIRKDMYAVEFVTDTGSRWEGCERAYINSELRMILVFRDLKDEVIQKQWADVPEHLQVKP